MLALVVALAATLVLTQPVLADQQSRYTVWSSVVLARTGERTPLVADFLPYELTSYGAQQVYNVGSFLRNRYITANDTSLSGGVAPIVGLNADILNNLELYASTLDWQYTAASAQAFIQGLYPPTTFSSRFVVGSLIDPTSYLASNEYIPNPLSGYQYAQIHTVGPVDPNFLYLSANLYCPSFDMAAEDYYQSQTFLDTQRQTRGLYESVGRALLADVMPIEEDWDYANAYQIYDYVSYQNTHNGSFAAELAQYNERNSNPSALNQLRWLADQQQFAALANLSAVNNVSHTTLPGGIYGSISTIAGNLFATKILIQFQNAIKYEGQVFKLNLLFADYAPFVSFFALSRLSARGTTFTGLPAFGSVASFELFSWTNSSTSLQFPDQSDLWVRFYFRNGTDNDEDEYRAYPLFGRDPDSLDMSWSEFQASMYSIALLDPGDWCLQCGAENLFCAAWNVSDGALSLGSESFTGGAASRRLSPAVGGVIGAAVSLAVAVLLFAAALLLGCVRVQAVHVGTKKSDMGGFKGGQKMASDQDLTIPKTKGGAFVESTTEQDGPMSPVAAGHERIGSWELKEAEAGRRNDAQDVRVPSFETERHVNPFADPVKAKETV